MGTAREIELLGKRYRIKSEYNESYLQSLAAQVNERVAEVQHRGVGLPLDAVLLAALNIADDLHQARGARGDQEQALADIGARTAKLISWIDAQL